MTSIAGNTYFRLVVILGDIVPVRLLPDGNRRQGQGLDGGVGPKFERGDLVRISGPRLAPPQTPPVVA